MYMNTCSHYTFMYMMHTCDVYMSCATHICICYCVCKRMFVCMYVCVRSTWEVNARVVRVNIS